MQQDYPLTIPDDVQTSETQRADALLQAWQRRLRLQDWLVEVEIHGGREMGRDLGRTTMAGQHKCAKIRLLNPEDHDPSRQVPYDLESTLVHELLHLHFCGFNFDDDSADQTALEIAINMIAHALTGKP